MNDKYDSSIFTEEMMKYDKECEFNESLRLESTGEANEVGE